MEDNTETLHVHLHGWPLQFTWRTQDFEGQTTSLGGEERVKNVLLVVGMRFFQSKMISREDKLE